MSSFTHPRFSSVENKKYIYIEKCVLLLMLFWTQLTFIV